MPEHKVEKHAPPTQTAFIISWQSDAIWYGRNSGWRYKSATGLLRIPRIHIYLYFNLFPRHSPDLTRATSKVVFSLNGTFMIASPYPRLPSRGGSWIFHGSRMEGGSLFKCAKAQYWYFLLWVDLDVYWVPMHLAHF